MEKTRSPPSHIIPYKGALSPDFWNHRLFMLICHLYVNKNIQNVIMLSAFLGVFHSTLYLRDPFMPLSIIIIHLFPLLTGFLFQKHTKAYLFILLSYFVMYYSIFLCYKIYSLWFWRNITQCNEKANTVHVTYHFFLFLNHRCESKVVGMST